MSLKKSNGNASIVNNKRVVFNIKGNDFKLIVSVNFLQEACYVIWFGTHKEYDKTHVETIAFDTRILTKKIIIMNWKVLKTEDDYNEASMRMI